MMPRMRILIVSNLDSNAPFGQFLRPFHLGRGLARTGAEVYNVGVDCRLVDFGPSWSTHAKSLKSYVHAARRAISEIRPDVVYGHEARGGAAAVLAAGGLPVAVDYHALPSLEWARYARTAPRTRAALYLAAAARSAGGEQLMARRGDAIIAAGQELADDLQRLHRPRVAPVVVPNGVSDDLLNASQMAQSPYTTGRKHAMATVPSAVTEANARALDFLQAVAKHLPTEDGAVDLHVVGSADGPQAAQLHYEGFQEDLRAWVGHADVCLLPYPKEASLAGGPRNKLLEYLAIGRTIVTTQEGLRGLREVADWPGVTVTSDDPAEYAAAIVAAADHAATSLESVRPRVRERLRWETLAEQVRVSLAGVV